MTRESKRVARRIVAVVLALLPAACRPGAGAPEAAIDAFVEAVQGEDVDRLYCLMAGASGAGELGRDAAERRVAFEGWLRARYDSYLEGREAGFVDLDEQGTALVKLFVLGRGTFLRHMASRQLAADVLTVESEVRFGYGAIDLSHFTPGTTFYVCGLPVGRVQAIRVPATSGEVRAEVLESIRVRWTLLASEPAGTCPGGFTVASVEPVPGSSTVADVAWMF